MHFTLKTSIFSTRLLLRLVCPWHRVLLRYCTRCWHTLLAMSHSSCSSTLCKLSYKILCVCVCEFCVYVTNRTQRSILPSAQVNPSFMPSLSLPSPSVLTLIYTTTSNWVRSWSRKPQMVAGGRLHLFEWTYSLLISPTDKLSKSLGFEGVGLFNCNLCNTSLVLVPKH